MKDIREKINLNLFNKDTAYKLNKTDFLMNVCWIL